MFSLKGIPKYFPTTFHLFRNLFFVTKICEYDEINTHILSLCNIFCNITHQEIWKIDKSAHQVQTKNVLLQITVYIKHNLSSYKGNRHHVLLHSLPWLIACHLTSFFCLLSSFRRVTQVKSIWRENKQRIEKFYTDYSNSTILKKFQ